MGYRLAEIDERYINLIVRDFWEFKCYGRDIEQLYQKGIFEKYIAINDSGDYLFRLPGCTRSEMLEKIYLVKYRNFCYEVVLVDPFNHRVNIVNGDYLHEDTLLMLKKNIVDAFSIYGVFIESYNSCLDGGNKLGYWVN